MAYLRYQIMRLTYRLFLIRVKVQNQVLIFLIHPIAVLANLWLLAIKLLLKEINADIIPEYTLHMQVLLPHSNKSRDTVFWHGPIQY